MRSTPRVFGTAAAVVAIAGALAACSSTVSGEPRAASTAQPPSSVAASVPPVTTTTAPTTTTTVQADGPTADFVASAKDADGYAFDVAVRLTVSDLGPSTEHDKPGEMSAYFTVSLDLGLTNRTDGREITFDPVAGVTQPLANPKFYLSALWPSTSPVCKTVANRGDGPCALVLGFGYVPGPLAPGGSLPLEVYSGLPNGAGTAGLAGFPEADWPAIRTALGHPDQYLLSYDGGNYQRFGCSINYRLGVPVATDSGKPDCESADYTPVPQPEPLN